MGWTGGSLRAPGTGLALDSRSDSLDGALIVQVSRRPPLDHAEGDLRAHLPALPGALYGSQQPVGLRPEQPAGGGHLDHDLRRARLPCGLRTRPFTLPRQAAPVLLDHQHPDGADRGRDRAPLPIFRNLALLDSVVGLIIAYLTFNLPFAIWLMNAFFADLPPSLEEAAMVDGATRFQAFWRVALPLVTPGIVTTGILCLIFSWNDYVFARTFSGPESQTIPIAAAQLITQTGIDWGKLTAIGTVVVLPMMLIGLAVRRWIVRGLTLGPVKGE